jgi:ribonuclease E
MVRSTASIALHVLRILEDALIKSSAHNIIMRTRSEVALYILNQKRANLSELEQRFGVNVAVIADDSLTGMSYHAMERGEPAAGVIEPLVRPEMVRAIEAPALADEEIFADEATEEDDGEVEADGEETEAGDGTRRRRRRRRRRGRDREATGINANAPQPSDDALAAVAQFGSFPERHAPEGTVEPGEEHNPLSADDGTLPGQKRDGRRRRSRRRGHGQNEGGSETINRAGHSDDFESMPAAGGADWPTDTEADSFPSGLDPQAATEFRDNIVAGLAPHVQGQASGAPSAPRSPAVATDVGDASATAMPNPASTNAPELAVVDDPNRPKRTGWWQRAKASMGG